MDVRVTFYNSALNNTANFDNSVVGIDTNNTTFGVILKRGHGTTGQGLQSFYNRGGSNVSGFISSGSAPSNSNNTMIIEVPNIGNFNMFKTYDGYYNNGFPTPDNFNPHKGYVASVGVQSNDDLTVNNLGIILGAQRANSGTSLVARFARIKVEYRNGSATALTNINRNSRYIQPHDNTYNPIGLWQFNNDLTDSSGNGKTLTVGAGTARYGDISPQLRGIFFDGSTRVQITDASFRLVGDMTIEMLCFIQTIPNATAPVIVSCMDNGETSATNYLYAIYPVQAGYFLQYFHEFSAGTNVTYSNTTGAIPIGEVFHLAMVRQSNQITFYVNGKLNGAVSSTLTAPDTVSGTQSFFVGGNLQDASFAGAVSSLKIINSALTASQIEGEYNRTLGNIYNVTSVNVQVSYEPVLLNASATLATFTKLALVNSTGGAVTVTLPVNPSFGQWHKIKDAFGTAATNNITISGNGKNIEQFSGSPASTLILNSNYDAVELVYNGTSWNIV